jgi:hypothetical protein
LRLLKFPSTRTFVAASIKPPFFGTPKPWSRRLLGQLIARLADFANCLRYRARNSLGRSILESLFKQILVDLDTFFDLFHCELSIPHGAS